MNTIEQARAILEADPLPRNAEAQLRKLEAQATEFERLEWPWIWEGFAQISPAQERSWINRVLFTSGNGTPADNQYNTNKGNTK